MSIATIETPRAERTLRLVPAADRFGRDAARHDLDALVDAAATELDASLIVTDPQLRPLAHHIRADAAAALRDWIVFRDPPRELRAELPARGRLLGLGHGTDVMECGAWTLAVVRTGTEVIGGVWTCDAGAAARDLLSVVAARAALHVGRREISRDPATRRRTEVLRSALAGTASIGELDLPADLRLFALPAAEQVVALRVGTLTSHAAVTAIDERVYVLGPADLDAARLAGGERCAVSEPLSARTPDLCEAKADVDRLLAQDDERAVVRVEEHRSALVLAELIELAGRSAGLRRGAIAALAAIDEEQKSSYLTTLRAYFATGCDLQRAANELYVHRNTLRYRLDRIRALTGLDVAEPTQQLVAALQLRMHDAGHPVRGTRAAPVFSAGSVLDEEQ